MKFETISTENVKPCSPTPPEKRTYNLSLLDRIVEPTYIAMALYFQVPDNMSTIDEHISNTTRILKQSLSQVLTRYYPLAGRCKEKLSIDCNDEGVLFVVSRCKSNLSDYLKTYDPALSHKLVPNDQAVHLAMFQVTYFDCGGIALGTSSLHSVADGTTMFTFIKDWSANAKGGKEQPVPDYEAGSLFLPKSNTMQTEPVRMFSLLEPYIKTGKPCSRRYIFHSSSISKLRAEHSSECSRFSRVEIISALFWKCLILALEDKTDTLVTFSVNLRRKCNPMLPDNSFGNYVWMCPSYGTKNEQPEIKELIGKVRNSMSKIDGDFMRNMQGDEGWSGYQCNLEETRKRLPENAECLLIVSWCNFGMYSVDFGWGKPVWMGACYLQEAETEIEKPLLSHLMLMDSRDGEGVEAWLKVDERYVSAFDQILQNHASIHPSPVNQDSFVATK